MNHKTYKARKRLLKDKVYRMFQVPGFRFQEDRGFAAFYVTILVLAVIFALAVSIAVLTYNEQKIIENVVKSNQTYYVAESGIEDALLRLVEEMNWSSPYNLTVGDGTTLVTISDIVGGARTIISDGNVLNRTRKVRVVYGISSEKTSFYYGAQVGEGGIQMDDGSTINGNVFSNGGIVAVSNTEITGTARVAQTGNKIQGGNIGDDAFVDICENANIGDTLTCTTNSGCTAAIVEILQEEITATSMPITQEQIDGWKSDAASGGTIGDYTLAAKQTGSLGPRKIDGYMTIQNQAQLSVTGTLWITGTLTIQDKARVTLDQNTYGSFSGVIVVDGTVTLQNTAKALGSGIEGSYLSIISTDSGTSAITIQDEFEADILYTHNGWIIIQNMANVREVTGYGVHLKNNAEITYEVGLQDAFFSSGPGGSWEVMSWEEIE